MDYLDKIKKQKIGINNSVINWSRVHLRNFPWRVNRTPYKILIAEILLRRTTSSAVNRIYSSFINDYPNVRLLSKSKIIDLEKKLKTLGYYRRRALIFKNIANTLIDEHNGNIPNNREDLCAINNIGPYISGAILSLGYDIPASMLDSNVERIYNKLFYNTIKKIHIKNKLLYIAELLIPNKEFVLYNLGLLDIGAKICTYKKILCIECPMSAYCEFSKLRDTSIF